MQEKNVKISIRNLYKIFGDDPETALSFATQGMEKPELLEEHNHVLGLKDINVDIHEGEITVIMGLSGSGKSTLIRHINRLIEPTAGEIKMDDIDIMHLSDEELRVMRQTKMSMVFQKFALLPHRTVMENVALSLELRGMKAKQREQEAQKWIEKVELEGYEDSYPNQCSGGMQQRVGIARALTSNSEVMLMDEAFSALDPIVRTNMQDLLLRLQQDLKKTIIFITHDLDEALKLADHLIILKDGYIVQQGEPQHILLNPNDIYIEEFVSDINRARVLRVRSIMSEIDPKVTTFAGQVDYNDNLENVIALSKGDTTKVFQVMQDDRPVGYLKMKDLFKALVPRIIIDDD